MYKLIKGKKGFGIWNHKDVECVPCCHKTKELAIEEWEYFETNNTNNKQFLKHRLTNEQIKQEKEKLLKQIL